MKRTQLKRTPLLAAGPSLQMSLFLSSSESKIPNVRRNSQGSESLRNMDDKKCPPWFEVIDLKARMIFHLTPCGVWVVPDFNVAYFHGFLDDHMGPDFNCHRFLGGFNHYRVHLALLKLRPSGVEAKSRQCVHRLVCLTKSGFTPPHT